MSFTNQTPNYGLPQWLAADKPKFLTDINDAFSNIDTQLKNANDTANTAADNATSALSIAGQAATTAEGAATVAGQAAALAQSVNELVGTLNAKMGTTSIATIGDGTVTGAIDNLNTRMDRYLDIDFTGTDANGYPTGNTDQIPDDIKYVQMYTTSNVFPLFNGQIIRMMYFTTNAGDPSGLFCKLYASQTVDFTIRYFY